MPEATITLSVLVTLDVEPHYAKKCTREDLIEMARGAIPHSMQTPCSVPDPQIIVGTVAQEEDGEPVFADARVEHDITDEPDIEFDDEGFTKAEAE